MAWFDPGPLEAPAAVQSGTPRGGEAQRTPRGRAQEAQTRGADTPSAHASEVVEEADTRRSTNCHRSLRGRFCREDGGADACGTWMIKPAAAVATRRALVALELATGAHLESDMHINK